jgi:hypothetical protein
VLASQPADDAVAVDPDVHWKRLRAVVVPCEDRGFLAIDREAEVLCRDTAHLGRAEVLRLSRGRSEQLEQRDRI